ncbi:unnamed protein product [Anisakis simplex]|uniref:FOG-3 protein (inferred by orthology to a C. elegans protein) n=1 Tax=Anisakis simplex TaxID=6269 RepID=A0A0M3K3S2_ANISI|nr:unnamed protein product [Anisakis simplex]
MYTELKEAMNFLSRFVRHTVPKRRLSIFFEQLANGLLVKYKATWNIENPAEGADERAIRINTSTGTTELVMLIGSTICLDMHRLLAAFPAELIVFWNAGEVFCRVGGATPTKLPVWSGDVNADKNYSPLPSALSRVDAMKSISNSTLYSNHLQVVNANHEIDYVRLELVPWNQHSDFFWSPAVFSPESVPKIVFRFTQIPEQVFSCGTFAVTRFGSRKPQPDHEALKRIQCAVTKTPPTVNGCNNQTNSSSANVTDLTALNQQSSWFCLMLLECDLSQNI